MDCMVAKNQTWLSDFHFHFPMGLKQGKEIQGKKPVPCHLSPPVVLGTSGLPSETCLAVNHFTCVLSPVWLCDATDCSPQGSSVYKICQVRILEWIVMSSSRGSFQLQGQICTSCIGRFFTTDTACEALVVLYIVLKIKMAYEALRFFVRIGIARAQQFFIYLGGTSWHAPNHCPFKSFITVVGSWVFMKFCHIFLLSCILIMHLNFLLISAHHI